MAEDCGLCAVALHARTREQGYSGQARWEWIAAIKQAVKIPSIAILVVISSLPFRLRTF